LCRSYPQSHHPTAVCARLKPPFSFIKVQIV
jgi:hypothetical protein